MRKYYNIHILSIRFSINKLSDYLLFFVLNHITKITSDLHWQKIASNLSNVFFHQTTKKYAIQPCLCSVRRSTVFKAYKSAFCCIVLNQSNNIIILLPSWCISILQGLFSLPFGSCYFFFLPLLKFSKRFVFQLWRW